MTEQELLRCGEFVLPGVARLLVQQREAHGPQPSYRGADRDPSQAGDHGAHRQAVPGRVQSIDAVTPHAIITNWRASALKERSASQDYFIDLCHLLGEPTPAEADPSGETYCFERGTRKDAGGDGWADVWKRHHSACDPDVQQRQRANLDAAFDQLRQYSLALENPPLLIVSDMVRFGSAPT